jgi:uncharacterized repeat protein (TIGR01451 family)
VAANANFNALTLTVAIAANAPASVTNTAYVSGGGEVDEENNEGTVTTAVQRGDLTVSKTAGTFTYGSNASYTIAVANAGPGGSYGLVTVVDTLPAGLTYVSAAGTGWTASAVQSAGRWIVTATTSQALAAAGNYNALTITATVTSATAAPVTNRVHVSGGNETNTTNNTGSVTTNSIAGPDLAITKATSLALFTPGQAANYTITVSSVGTSNVSGSSGTPIVVVDTLPVGLTLATAPAAPTGWNTLTSTLDALTGRYIVRATRTSNLNVGVSIAFTINPLVTTAAIPTAYNRAHVSAGVQHNTLNDTASVTTPVAATDLVIVKTATGTFYVGGTASYRIVVRNAGSAPTAGTITVTDPLPAGLTWIAGSSSGAGWTLVASGQTVTATYAGAALAPNDSTVFVLGVAVGADAVPTVTNTATVAGGGDANTANNSSTVTTPVGAQPDLTVSKSAGTLTFGSVGSYAVRVRNVGTSQTTGTITVTDTLPGGLTFVPGSGTGADWTVGSGNGTVVVATRTTAIAAGDSTLLTFQVNVGAAAVPSVSNKVYVAGGGQFNTTNDTARVSTPVLAPDLVIAKTADPLESGQAGTFTITVTNAGTAVTTALITVTDVLPGNLTFVGAAGTGWSVVTAGQTVIATFAGPLAPGASATFTLTTLVTAPAGAFVTNTADVEGGGEVDAGNNSASVTVAVSGRPALLLLKSASPEGSVFPGAELTYTISFQNSGNADAIDVQVSDVLPEQVQFKLGSADAVLPPGIVSQLEYFDGSAWSQAPPVATCGAPAGFNGCVTALRLRLLQPLPAAEQGSWSFLVRVK